MAPVVGRRVSEVRIPERNYGRSRIEAPGRAYGFMAFKETTADPMSVASARTKELYELVYSLWSASLRPKEK
jgi:hypothetical protein